MKALLASLSSALLVGGAIALSASAQGGGGPHCRGGGGWGGGGQYGRMYDPKTVETVSGEVTAVEPVTPMKQMCGGVQLQLKTAKETIPVHLGPSWYINNQDIQIQPKDKVEVKGSRVTFNDKPAIIAAEVRKGDEVLKLRDENGMPYWAGWRRR